MQSIILIMLISPREVALSYGVISELPRNPVICSHKHMRTPSSERFSSRAPSSNCVGFTSSWELSRPRELVSFGADRELFRSVEALEFCL